MGNRTKRFAFSLVSGYGSILANVLFTMVSVPLALHYLGKEQFGLWALAAQISGYLMLLDVGMAGATFRFAADHKDDVNGGEFGSVLLTGGIVFVIQGVAIAILGVVLAVLAPRLFGVSPELAGPFSRVILVLSLTSSASFAFRMVVAPLWAFQRMDLVNACGGLGLLLRLALFWAFLRLGWGIDSLAISGIPPLLVTYSVYWWVCRRNGHYPSRGCWGRPNWGLFKSIFAFGRDSMMLILGTQMVNATQIAIISRVLGLDAAAVFSIATKFYLLSSQVFHKVVESAAPGLTELFTRGESRRFVERYWDVILLTVASSTMGAVALAGGNRDFVMLWTAGKIQWSVSGDVMLGFLILITSLSRCFVSVFGMTKDLRSVRMLYFLEGLLFVPLAIVAAKSFGVEGVLAASLFAHVSVVSFPALKAASTVLHSCSRMIKPLGVAGLLLGVTALAGLLGEWLDLGLILRLSITGALVAISGIVAWATMVPRALRQQLIGRLRMIWRLPRPS